MASNEAIWAATAQMIPHHSKAGFLQIENYESDTRFQDTDNVARLNMILDLVGTDAAAGLLTGCHFGSNIRALPSH